MNDFKKGLSLLVSFVKKNPFKYWGLLVSGFSTGLMLQLAWIYRACKDYPFLNPEKIACQDNLLRVFVSPPIFIVAFSLLYVFSLGLVFGYLNKKYKIKDREKLSLDISNSLGLWAFVLLWPLLDYGHWFFIILLVVILILIGSLASKSISTFLPIVIDCNADIPNNVLMVNLGGNLTVKNKMFIYDKMVQIMEILPDFKKVNLNLASIQKTDTVGNSFLSALEASSKILEISFLKSAHPTTNKKKPRIAKK